jgi:hypothetical protein
MRLSERDLLDMWAAGEAQHPIDRALTALSWVSGARRGVLADLPIGERDARLFALGRALNGSRVPATAACPSCRETVEMSLDLDALGSGGHDRDDAIEREIFVEHAGFQLRCRQPTSRDLAAVARAADDDEARAMLVAACVIEARLDGEAVAPGALSDEVIAGAEDALASMQPPAEIDIALTCPACAATWLAPFDIGEAVWSAIRAAAQRTMNDVAELARAYGWSEDTVLALPVERRRYYVERA